MNDKPQFLIYKLKSELPKKGGYGAWVSLQYWHYTDLETMSDTNNI